jgi:predicted transcriptional regulator
MSKAVLISIRPMWSQKIMSGQKTIEVRKTRPKMNPPFKCYIYCTKPEEKLLTIMKDGDENYGETYHGKPVFIKTEKAPTTGLWDKRQKVIGEFICDAITRVNICGFWDDSGKQLENRLKETCLTSEELCGYLGTQVGYGLHISDLKIYDHPRELREFYAVPNEVEVALKAKSKPITRPPQSWRYVEEELWSD